MIEIVKTTDEAVAGIEDGATVLIGGFSTAGQPIQLIDAVRRSDVRDLTVVNNNAGNGDLGLAALLATGQVRKIICSFPRQSDSYIFDELYRAGKIELELIPQGNLGSLPASLGSALRLRSSPRQVVARAAGGDGAAPRRRWSLVRGEASRCCPTPAGAACPRRR